MKVSNVDCRPCRLSDDFFAVAQCLYQTDPYIYPYLCNGDEESAVSLLAQCIALPGNLFYCRNLTVAESNGKIVGVICAISGMQAYTFLDGLMIPEEYTPFVRHVADGYFNPLFEENFRLSGKNIVCVSVLEGWRRSGIGQAMLSYYLESIGKQPVYLETIADNIPAVSLYEKLGFRLIEERNGFEPSGALLPCKLYRMIPC